MISHSIKRGPTVFHEALGYGVFVKYINTDFALIQFDDGAHSIHRKRLTVVEEEL